MAGLSRPRQNKTFEGPPAGRAIEGQASRGELRLQVVDLRSVDAVHWLRITGIIEELYDVAVLPEIRRPMAIGIKTDDIRRVITVAPGPSDTAPEAD